MTMTLDQVEKLLQSPPSQIFAGDTEVRHRALAQACHPDKFPGDLAMQERATGVFQKLEAAWVEFQKPPTIYQSKDHRYTVLKPLGKGDVSRVCLAQREDDAQVAIKVSYIRDANKLLDQEAKILADLHLQANAKSYAEYLPMPLELFSTPDGLRVAVQSYREGFYTAQEILTRHPDGLEPRHIAWMLKRVLTVLGFTHRANYIHSGLTPRNVMFHAENHGC
jgi:serine/threonine protein kinase